MKNQFGQLSCDEFIALLASSAPAPGGGGAAALCASLSAALCAMAANLSRLKQGTEEIAQKAEKQAKLLLTLIDEDAEGFEPLAKAYSLPKDTPGYVEIKRSATMTACGAPMKLLDALSEITGLIEDMRQLSSKLLLSDVGCAASLCAAAVKCAAMNVFVNTRLLKGDADAENLTVKAGDTLNNLLPRLEAIERDVFDFLTE